MPRGPLALRRVLRSSSRRSCQLRNRGEQLRGIDRLREMDLIPAAQCADAILRSAYAVSAAAGMPRTAGLLLARIFAIRSNPSMRGIARSDTRTSGTSSAIVSSAVAAELATDTRPPAASMISRVMFSASRSSSMTSTRRPRKSGRATLRCSYSTTTFAGGGAAASKRAAIAGRRTRNVAPRPGPSLAA